MPGAVAICGLHTFLGGALARRLLQRGARVAGIGRVRPAALPPAAEWCAQDATDPGAERVIAKLLRRKKIRALALCDAALPPAAARNYFRAAALAEVPRVVLESSTQCYGALPQNPHFLPEKHLLRGHPHSPALAARIAVEELAAEARVQNPHQSYTLLRPCWVLGPQAEHRAARYFARAHCPVPLGYDPLLQFVHEDDCAAAFARALLGAPRAGAFNVVAPGALPLSVLLRSAGKRALPLPHAALRWLPGEEAPAAFFDFLRFGWLAEGRKGWRAFGKPQFSTRETWAAFVEARRARRAAA